MKELTTQIDHEEKQTLQLEQITQRPDPIVDIPAELLDSQTQQQSSAEPPSISTDGLRHEIKMTIEPWRIHEVESALWLHRAGFRSAFPQRRVNNIYFDDPRMTSFQENLAGLADRRKLRVRWYGKNRSAVCGMLEYKCKRDLNGWKIRCPLTTAKNLEQMTWKQITESIRQDSPSEFRHIFHQSWIAVLINTYDREYYVSSDQRVRVTVDLPGRCYDQRLGRRPNFSRLVPTEPWIIVEVKASVAHRDQLADAVSNLPLRVSKHSKYQSGVTAILDI